MAEEIKRFKHSLMNQMKTVLVKTDSDKLAGQFMGTGDYETVNLPADKKVINLRGDGVRSAVFDITYLVGILKLLRKGGSKKVLFVVEDDKPLTIYTITKVQNMKTQTGTEDKESRVYVAPMGRE
jgi:hypothetical protein